MGLLDALNTDEARLGLGLLAAGGYSPTPMSVGQRVQMALQGMDAQKRNTLQNKLLESQVAENLSQDALRKAQLAQQAKRDAYFMGEAGLPGSGGAQAPGPLGAPASGAPPAVGQGAGYIQPPAADRFTQWSQQFGIPRDALVNDYMTNGGKGIAEMLFKRGTPDMQVSNGYAYDKNRVGAGYLPQLNMSQDGKTSMVRIGPDGLPLVSAPQGALETFGGYQRAAAGLKPIKVFNPKTQREEFSNEADVAQPRPGYGTEGQMRTTASGDMGADPMGIQRELRQAQADLGKVTDPASKAQLQAYIADLQAQAVRTPVQAGSVAAGPSAAEATANEAARVRAVETAKADVGRDTALQTDVKTANKFLNITKQVEDVFKKGPTNSGLGSMLDSSAAFFGKSTEGAEAAQRLKALGGWLVANVPRMEGPQSNFDVANYQVMAADVANDKLPLERRKAALDSIKTMMQGIAKQVKPEGSWDDKPKGELLSSLPTANASNKGKAYRDTTTGKIMRSNGLQWREE